MEIELTNPSLTFELGNQGGSIQQIQSDWEQTDNTKVDYIKNKPTIPSLDGYATEEYVDEAVSNVDSHKYKSLERIDEYLYKATFDEVQEYIPTNDIPTGGCTSFVKNGKLYRNFDWNYDNRATFIVRTRDFEGIAYIDGLNGNEELNSALVDQLPYHITDGCNNYGIRVSEHVLFNDFDYVGSGDNPIQLIPYKILTECESLDYLEGTEFTNYLSNLYIPTQLTEAEYLLHFIVTDGTDTYYIRPSDNGYGVENITLNPRLTNFKWVNKSTIVNRNDSDLQDRPTGIERWNAVNGVGSLVRMDFLKFTNAYTLSNRLSEFIGINGTTKDSTDEELEAIRDTAHQAYLERTRNGYTWQTVHSVVYSDKGIEALYTQEDFEHKKYGNPEPEQYIKSVGTGDPEQIVFFDQDDNFTIWQNPSNNVFIATYGITSYNEVMTAYLEGKLIFVKKDNGFPLHFALMTSRTNNEFWFGFIESFISAIYVNTYTIVLRQNGWSEELCQLSNESGTDSTVFVEYEVSSYREVEECWYNDIPCYCKSDDYRYQLSYYEDNTYYFSCSTLDDIKFVYVNENDEWYKDKRPLPK